MSVISISAAVGINASNRRGDVRRIQAALNHFIKSGKLRGVKRLAVDGKCGPKTTEAILMFQNQNALLSTEHFQGQIHAHGMTIVFMNRNAGPRSDSTSEPTESISFNYARMEME
jgi:hypothetical protein